MDLDILEDTTQAYEERNFRRLYDCVLDYLIKKTGISEDEINDAISHMKRSFRYEYGHCCFSDIDLNQVNMLCGYIHRYGPHGAGLARSRIVSALYNCPELESILEKSQLNVVSLGGGPANDVIGFASAMSQFEFPGDLMIRVLDGAINFRPCCQLVERLLHRNDFGGASEFYRQERIGIDFEQCVLPRNLPNLREFDVIIICKLLSTMDWDVKKAFIRNLHLAMKPSAFILLIDSPFTDDLWYDKFRVLYLSRQDDEYSPSILPSYRFGHDDDLTSKARIAVLKKITLQQNFISCTTDW